MTRSLQRSREVTAAAKAITALGHPIYVYVEDRSYPISTRQQIIKRGIPATIEAIDCHIAALRKMLAIGHSFAGFMMSHPDAPVLLPEHFDVGSLERAVIAYVIDPNGDGDADDDDETPTVNANDDRQDVDDLLGEVPPLQDHLGWALPDFMSIYQTSMTRSAAWTLLVYAEQEIAALTGIRCILEPPLDAAALKGSRHPLELLA